MNAPGRLGLYGAGLVVVFGVAFAAAGALAPDSSVAAWAEAGYSSHGEQALERTAGASDDQEVDVSGVMSAASGFTMGAVQAPTSVGTDGELSFDIRDTSDVPISEFDTAHDKQLHLIVVRNDGREYRHVHPELDPKTGVWSLPWSWNAAGTYRLYADFASGGVSATLSRSVDVAGQLTPEPETVVTRRDTVDGFDVTVSGDLVAGTGSELTVEVSRDGGPVTVLEPYLGAFGHLVALRDGDLAYLHVHAHGEEPQPGDLAGPEVVFTAETPTPGRYLLYLDFQVDGQVHTAQFVLEATATASGQADTEDDAEHDGH
ncbi:heavy-metal-associated domain-containing protein [Microbacterium esteraromaticum]|uniref:heavy-metal-associated domain-containing protein n=1 Tax=Microbacterium esteraromaticum TaxID=57043 RepID=UPI001A8CA50C|nr:heavy-metal-associated domain-containing protein [Microbacterium esteraromaticum]MBN8424372.1 heavy-metal-associated domain-containing protein [Microbacterium esteraromaticum]